VSAPNSAHADWERDLAIALADIARRPGRLALSPPTPSDLGSEAQSDASAQLSDVPTEIRA